MWSWLSAVARQRLTVEEALAIAGQWLPGLYEIGGFSVTVLPHANGKLVAAYRAGSSARQLFQVSKDRCRWVPAGPVIWLV